MKKLIFLSLLLFSTLQLSAQVTTLDWANTIKGSGFEQVWDLHIDAQENVLVIGNFSGTADFNPESETFNLTSSGSQDVYVLKQNSAGAFLWAVKIGGSEEVLGQGIYTDTDDNVYVTGSFQGTVDFDPSSEEYLLNSAGNKDIFVCKLSSDGEFVWAHRIGGSSLDEAKDITGDDNNDIYLTGRFVGDIDFDPGNGVAELDGFGSFPDMFILKLDADGNYQWAQKTGVGNADGGEALVVDNQNNVIVAGIFAGNVDFDPGSGTTQMSSDGIADIFFTKFSSQGNFMWVHTFNGEEFESPQGLAVDQFDNIYTTGFFRATTDFNPAGTPAVLTSFGAEDSFVAKLNTQGDLVWVKQIGGVDLDWSYAIAVDVLGDVYTTGFFYSSPDFNPGSDVFNLTSSGIEDAFLCKLNTNGEFVWAKQMGGSSSDSGYGIEIGPTGDIYTTGIFWGTADLDPETTVLNITPQSGPDIYIVKVDQTIMTSNTIELTNNSFEVFPSPGSDYFILKNREAAFNPTRIYMTNLANQIVKEEWIAGEHEQAIDCTNLDAGFYLIHIEQDGKQAVVKWVKQ